MHRHSRKWIDRKKKNNKNKLNWKEKTKTNRPTNEKMQHKLKWNLWMSSHIICRTIVVKLKFSSSSVRQNLKIVFLRKAIGGVAVSCPDILNVFGKYVAFVQEIKIQQRTKRTHTTNVIFSFSLKKWIRSRAQHSSSQLSRKKKLRRV